MLLKPRFGLGVIERLLPRRKSVTIAIGFRYAEGILVCSDSQYTAGTAKYNEKKIFRAEIGQDKLVFGIAGSVPYGKMAIEKSVLAIAENKKNRKRKSLRFTVEQVLLSLHKKHIYVHPAFRGEGGPDFWLIVGTWSRREGLDFFYTNETAMNDITDFQSLGCGQDLSRFILKSIFRHRKLSLDDAASVAIHVLREVKDNVAFCGGPSQLAFLTKSGKMGGKLGMETFGKEEMSSTISSSVRRLYLVAADLKTKQEEVDVEIESIALTVKTARDYAAHHKEMSESSTEILKASASLVEPPDFKL